MPLSGLRVVDLTRILAGPFCSMLLANMGYARDQDRNSGRGRPGPPARCRALRFELVFRRLQPQQALADSQSATSRRLHSFGEAELAVICWWRTSAPAISAVDAFWWPLVRASARRPMGSGGGLIALLAGAGAPRWRCLHGEVGIAVGWVGWDEISGKASVSSLHARS